MQESKSIGFVNRDLTPGYSRWNLDDLLIKYNKADSVELSIPKGSK